MNVVRCEVEDERRLSGVLRYVPAFNPWSRKAAAPRPDFVVIKDGVTVALLDAKYRDLWKESLPPSMLYQLALYAASHPSKVSTILYPTTISDATEARIEAREPVGDRPFAQVRLRPVVLSKLESLVLDGPGPKAIEAGRDYARWLAFGN